MSKIKILQVNKLYYPTIGGIEKIIQQIAEGLAEKTDMKVLVCKEKGKTRIEKVNEVEIHRAGSFGVISSVPISFSFFWEFHRLSKDRDVIHFHFPFPLGDLACLLSGYKGKVVIWWHSDIVRQKRLMKIYRPLMEWFLRRADLIIVATEGHIEYSNYLKKYRNKCIVIPFGTDKTIMDNSKRWIESQYNNQYKKKECVRFLFVGRLVYYKGCKVLLEAFKEVERAELIMVGKGEMGDELKQLSSFLELEDRVQFLGSLSEEELSKQFGLCDVFVLPSILKSEAFGLVQIEAMAYEKPVINTNLPSGVPYVSIDKVTGLTVEPGNIKELSMAMQWMVDHEKERIMMGKCARKRVLEEYQMDGMMNKLLSAYEGIL